MNPRTLTATRYVAPLREGGSLPAIIEADDDGLYVLKFRGAGQGPKALIAELIAAQLGRFAGLPIPEVVLMHVSADLARTEPDSEIQSLVRASVGMNLAMDYLPGAVTYDSLADRIDAALAARIVWFDAYLTNVDRTARNTNMLIWHRSLHLIDHGAALLFHHAWDTDPERCHESFPAIRDHVLLPLADALQDASDSMRAAVTKDAIAEVVGYIPERWLDARVGVQESRSVYREYLTQRLEQPLRFVEEAVRARSLLV